jgi:hypothetical protein
MFASKNIPKIFIKYTKTCLGVIYMWSACGGNGYGLQPFLLPYSPPLQTPFVCQNVNAFSGYPLSQLGIEKENKI